MVRIPDRGSCPLELCILLLCLASRLKNKIKEKGLAPDELDALASETGIETPSFSHAVRSPKLRRKCGRNRTCRRGKREVSGFPEKTEGDPEVENLAEFESLSDSDSDDQYSRLGALRVNHINYFKYFDKGKLS